MWMILAAFIFLLAGWIFAMNLDERFFGGRFLVRSQTSSEAFKASLGRVLSQKDRPFVDWELIPGDWVNDKMRIPIQDRRLDEMRKAIVQAIESCQHEGRLNPAAVNLIEQTVRELVAQSPEL